MKNIRKLYLLDKIDNDKRLEQDILLPYSLEL